MAKTKRTHRKHHAGDVVSLESQAAAFIGWQVNTGDQAEADVEVKEARRGSTADKAGKLLEQICLKQTKKDEASVARAVGCQAHSTGCD